jgi:hypothetical protein
MGAVKFKYPEACSFPTQAKTGERVEVKVYVVNTNMPIVPGVVPDCVKTLLAAVFASDPQGKNVIGRAEIEFNACCFLWANEVTTVTITFTMPSIDVYMAFFLYQIIEDKWTLVDSTIFFVIDNPAWPPFWQTIWTTKILGLELYKWILISLGVSAGVIIATAATRS